MRKWRIIRNGNNKYIVQYQVDTMTSTRWHDSYYADSQKEADRVLDKNIRDGQITVIREVEIG